jgi:hypothetical protein
LGTWGPLVRTVGHATWLSGQVSSLHHLWALDTMSTASAGHIAGDAAGRLHLGSVQPMLCATSFPRVILSVTMPYFGHNEDMHGFWSTWCFPSSDVLEMVDQQNSWNSLVISTYVLYLD